MGAQAGAVTLAREPYLQSVTTQSALVVWRTVSAAACTLTAVAPGQTLSAVTPAGVEHVAAITGLTPSTRYDYRVRSGGLLAGGSEYYLATPPLPGTGQTTRFVMFGDCGTGTATQTAVASALTSQLADFALVLGDIVYPGGEASLYDDRFFTPYAPLLRHTPAFTVIGNHDIIDAATYFDTWHLPVNPIDGTERYYSFDWGDFHAIALDTNSPFTSEILDWIAADLDASSRRWKMVLFHHTMYSCGLYHGTTPSLVSTLAPIFESHGVDLVLYAHDHHYERSFPMRGDVPVGTAMEPNYVNPGAPIYVISGAAGGTREVATGCAHTARAIATPSFVRVTATGDALALEAVDADGAVLDRMTLSKNGAPPPPPLATLRVLAPNGGQSLVVGQTTTAQWTASASVASVRIELSRNGALGPWETLAASTPNDGSEAWSVTSPTSALCLLRVVDAANPAVSDVSDAPFQIAGPVPPGGAAVATINFQPAAAPVPAGYTADTGALFDPARGFGWTSAQTVRARGTMPDDPRDSFVDVVNSSTAIWELALPNATYFVSMTCGDPQTTATNRVTVEGVAAFADVPTNANQFASVTQMPVIVNDGRLTITLGGASPTTLTHTKLNSVVVAAAAAIVTPYALLSPSGGSSLCLGTPTPVRWSGSGASPPILIVMSRAGIGGPWEPLMASLSDDGQESWTPSGAPTSTGALRLLDSGGRVLATSTSPFELTAPSLRLLSPNGGEAWEVGSVRTFVWTSDCYTGNVRIDVSRNGPTGPWTTLLPSTPSDGQESWLVRPEDAGWTHARVVAVPFGTPTDASDTAFHVVSASSSTETTLRIDFGTANAAPASGHAADAGLPFDATRGFGWSQAVTTVQRDLLPNDCRDSFAQVANNTTATWEMVLPNGDYRVSLTCGDPFTTGTHRVAIEGQVVVQDVYATGGVFVTRNEIPVSVRDGRLTVTLGGSGAATATKLDCIEVRFGGVRRTLRNQRQTVASDRPAESVLAAPDRPVRGSAIFAMDVARAGAVRLAVYDVRGRRVALLQNGVLEAGHYERTWDTIDERGRSLAAGVYFAHFEAPDRDDRQRVVVVH